MEPIQERVPTMTMGCDESQCFSRGSSKNGTFFYDISDWDDVLTCYGDKDGAFFPMMCANGYLPVIVENEPVVTVTGTAKHGGAEIHHAFTNLPLHYFTCCPPHNLGNNDLGSEGKATTIAGVSRHCSDPVYAPDEWKPEDGDDETIVSLCASQGDRKFPRRTKNFWNTASFVCCDILDPNDVISNNNKTTTDLAWIDTDAEYLDDVECVPFCNRWYDRCWHDPNHVGQIFARGRVCGTPENDARFRFPRPIGSDAFDMPVGRFQCCKTGPALPSFVQDAAFRTEIAIFLTIYSIAAIASTLVVVGLSLPLLIQLCNKTYRGVDTGRGRLDSSSRRQLGMSATSKSRRQQLSSSVSSKSRRRQLSSSVSSRSRQHQLLNSSISSNPRRQIRAPSYSPYNLYLVYLAIPDLLVSLYFIFCICLPMIRQQDIRFKFVIPVQVAYGISNTFLNAIVCNQILKLLQSSKRGRRVPPPSLARVTLQAISLYWLSISLFLMIYFFDVASVQAIQDDNQDRSEKMDLVYEISIYTGFVLMIPTVLYVIYVAFVVCWRKLIPPANRKSITHRANRVLAIYFFRIVAVFFLVWVLCLVLYFVGGRSQTGTAWPFMLIFTSFGTQSIFTTCAILTSPSCRKYIKDLATLSYLIPWDRICYRRDENENIGDPNSTGTDSTTDRNNAAHMHSSPLEIDLTETAVDMTATERAMIEMNIEVADETNTGEVSGRDDEWDDNDDLLSEEEHLQSMEILEQFSTAFRVSGSKSRTTNSRSSAFNSLSSAFNFRSSDKTEG